MFKKIVVAVDGSEQGNHAIVMACQLASKFSSEIHLVHVPQLELAAIAVGAGMVEIPVSREEIAAAGKDTIKKAEALAKSHGCTPKNSQIDSGDPAYAIVEYVKSVNADLVVAGRRGLGKITGLLMGSVSQKLGQLAPCAVLTVK